MRTVLGLHFYIPYSTGSWDSVNRWEVYGETNVLEVQSTNPSLYIPTPFLKRLAGFKPAYLAHYRQFDIPNMALQDKRD
jgi:hypothetical protein